MRKPLLIALMLSLIVGAGGIHFLLTRPPTQDPGRTALPTPNFDSRPAASALILIDIQHDFWVPDVADAHPGFPKRVARIVQEFRDRGQPVVHVRTVFDPNLDNWAREFRSIHLDLELCRAGSDGYRPLDCAVGAGSEPVFEKANLDGFSIAALRDYLAQKGVQRLYLCGLYTDVCVLSTGLSAFNSGYEVHLVTDCCASVRQMHDFVLQRYGGFVFSLDHSGDVIRDLESFGS